MTSMTFKKIHFNGINMQIPEKWNYETSEYNEEDGTKSYCLSISAGGKKFKSIDISWGIIPEGADAYTEACATYEEVVLEDDLSADEEPVICFEFQKREAYGFNVWTDEGVPCFFFCVGIPAKGSNHLLTVLASATSNEDIQSLIDLVEKHLTID